MLNIGHRQRNILIGVMGMGVLVIIAGIVRLLRIIAQLNHAYDPSYDLPFASYDVVIWSSVEVNTGLVCAAAPATRPLVRLLLPSLLSSESGGNLDVTIERRINYADRTPNSSSSQPDSRTLELESRLQSESGKSGELWDCGGLLKDETCSVVRQ
jgi:hypothetical protein